MRLVLDIGPLVLFFAANAKFGIYVATGAFMVAILAALAVSYAMTRHLAVMPLVTAVIVLVFGGLTLVLHDDLFIKLKPTVELKIVETIPGVKGDTATGGGKPAKLETGITVTVPLFVNEGDTIKVNTETGEYMERA